MILKSNMEPRRIRWEIGPIKGVFGWEAVRNNMRKRTFLFQYRAIEWVRAETHYDWDNFGLVSETLIKGRDGAYRASDTYPRSSDPEDSAG